MPQSSKSLTGRLTAKVGPLPVWGWAAVILGAYLLYTRTTGGGSATSSNSTGVTANDGTADSGAQVPASGAGSPADNVSSQVADALNVNSSVLDALTSQLLSAPTPYSEFGDSPLAGAPATDAAQTTAATTGAASTSTAAAPSTAAQVGGNVHATQTAAGVLHWGGLTFTTKAAFDKWARTHGTTTSRELANYPQARSIYGTLR